MSELDLSPEARRRLWQCYSLLLRLAEEADEDTLEETELGEAKESVRTTEANELIRLNDNDTTCAEQVNTDELAEKRTRKAQIHNETTRATQEG